MENEIKKSPNKKSILLLILTIISLMIVLLNLGRSVIFPIPWVQEFEDNGDAMRAEGKDGSVIIDRAYSRLSFLDEEGKICRVIDGNGLALRRFYQQVVCSGDTYYVLDNEIAADSIFTKNEHITAYDADGRVRNVLYAADYYKEKEGQNVQNGLIKKIKPCDDGIIAFFYDAETFKVTIHRISNTGEDKVLDEITLSGHFRFMTDFDYNLKAKKFAGLSLEYQVFEHDAGGERILPLAPEFMNKFPGVFVVNDAGKVSIETIPDSHVPQSASYTFLFVIGKMAFWISLAYLVILLIYEIIRYFKKMAGEGERQKMLLIGFAMVVAALIYFISAYYSNTMQQSSRVSREAEISSLTFTLAKDPENILSLVAEEEDLTDKVMHEKTDEVGMYLLMISGHSAKNDSNIFINLYQRMNDGRVIPLISTLDMMNLNVPWKKDTEALKKIDRGEIYNTVYTAESGEIMSAVAALTNAEGSIVGYVETGSHIGVMTVGQFRKIITVFVTLLTFVVGIVLFFIELKGIFDAGKKQKALVEKGHPHPEIAHFRSMRLCIEFILKFDSVLMILIAKDLLLKNGITNIALLVGLPATLMSIGMLIGQMVSDVCLPRFYVKRVIVTAAALNVVVFAATAFLIYQGSFWGYCVGIFLANVCFGVMAGPSLIMPFLSGDEKMRFEMNNEKSMAGISASVISVMLAGFVAQYFGNYAIYLFALLPLAGVLFISLKVLPKATYYGRSKKDSQKKKLSIWEYMKFLFSPAILLLIILMIIPSDAASGYKSFFFPLFSQDYGLSKDFISNLVVLANFTAFLLNKPLNNLVKNKDYWFNTVLFLGLSGLIYLSFKANDSIIWAVIVIILIAITDKFLSPNINMLWPRQCMAKGLPPESFNSMFIYVSNISSIIRPTIMGVFLALGTPSNCIWMGVALIICTVLFAVLTARSPMRTYQETQ